MTNYDAIIIGGGHNGLVCAAYLARAGRDVLLVELPFTTSVNDDLEIKVEYSGIPERKNRYITRADPFPVSGCH